MHSLNKKIITKYVYVFYSVALLFSFYLGNYGYKIDLVGVTLKPYMAMLAMSLFFISFSRLQFDLSTLLYSLFAAAYIFLSSFQEANGGSLRLSLGLILVLLSVVIVRTLFLKHTIPLKIELVFKLFLIVSICLYLIGCVDIWHSGTGRVVSFGVMRDRGMIRFAGLLGNPNYYTAFAIPALFYFLYHNLLWLILALSTIVLTFSFSGLSSVFIGMVIGLLFFSERRSNFVFGVSLILASILFVGLSIGFEFIPSRALDAFSLRLEVLSTGSGRFDMWKFCLNFFQDNPIGGIGIDSLKYYTGHILGIVNAHNTYLEVLVEGGGVVFVLFCFFILQLLRDAHSITLIRREHSWLFLAAVSVFINLFFVSATVNSSLILIFLFIGIVKDRELGSYNKKVLKV